MSQFSGWNERKVKDLQRRGMIRGYQNGTQNLSRNIPHKNKKNIPPKASKEKTWLGWNLQYWCNEHAVTLAFEHHFHPERGWRFDWAIPALKIAIEYEGIFSQKSRHTTVTGYTGDMQKYNAAQLLGWRIIRVTAIDYKSVLKQLNAYVA